MQHRKEDKYNYEEDQSVRRNISIPLWMHNDIKQKKNAHGFDFSEYVQNKYLEDFYEESHLKKKIAELKTQISIYEQKTQNIKEHNHYFRFSLSKRQLRWLNSALVDIKDGDATREGSRQAFNHEFGTNYTIEEFTEVMVYANKRQKP